MAIRRIILFLALLTTAVGAVAQSKWAYVKGTSVNLRAEPNTSSAILGKVSSGDFLYIDQNYPIGEWVRLEIQDADEEGPYSYFPYIKSDFIRVLNADEFPSEKINSTFSFDIPHKNHCTYGFLTFNRRGENEVECNIMVKNSELQKSGGNGIIDNRSFIVNYEDGCLRQPDEIVNFWGPECCVYDSASGLLYYAGYLWEEEK